MATVDPQARDAIVAPTLGATCLFAGFCWALFTPGGPPKSAPPEPLDPIVLAVVDDGIAGAFEVDTGPGAEATADDGSEDVESGLPTRKVTATTRSVDRSRRPTLRPLRTFVVGGTRSGESGTSTSGGHVVYPSPVCCMPPSKPIPEIRTKPPEPKTQGDEATQG